MEGKRSRNEELYCYPQSEGNRRKKNKLEIKPDEQLRLCGLWGKNQCPEGDLMGHAGGEAFPNQAFPIPEG